MRLFVAIELSEQVRAVLKEAQQSLGRTCPGVRWVKAEQLHLTVKFLGDVPDGDVAGVSQAIARAAAASQSFNMDVAGCGCFPPRGDVRIVWAGAQEGTGALNQCVEAVEVELERLGFRREDRAFSPHITVGRVREDRSGGKLRAGVGAYRLSAGDQPVVSLTLMSSVLSPQGPTYAPVSRSKLGS